MSSSPLITQIPELCPKCRPFSLGVGGGKKVRRFEVSVEGQGQGERDEREEEVGGDGDRGERESNHGEGVKEGEKGDKEDKSDKCQGRSKQKGIYIGKRPDTHTIPSSTNGSPDLSPPPAFSVFKRILAALIPGTSPHIDHKPTDSDSTSKPNNATDTEGAINESAESKGKDEGEAREKDSLQKEKQKQSWHKVNRDPDWEIVQREGGS
ncbi:hypothetical protein BKA64DRAFT_754765 [Cadophora sp. MPI-SDFR-AT-0126]|nr:hypothetical protein BKA64DRAFT_754765 [Leotiomycetes sp. MPI-SDFR-AT-0126]